MLLWMTPVTASLNPFKRSLYPNTLTHKKASEELSEAFSYIIMRVVRKAFFAEPESNLTLPSLYAFRSALYT